MGSEKQPQYSIENVPLNTYRPIRVVCLGGGYSGLMMAIIVEQKMKSHNVDFQIYEMNHDMGGTWLVNRYPGCQCDIPAHNYEFSFCPNPSWPNYYATSEQIYDYIKDTAKKYDCEKYFAYRHEVTAAVWNEETSKWALTVKTAGGEFQDDCDVFINAGGVLNNWSWPKIPGLEKFQGKLMHSASWDSSFDFTGKKAAVIGIGSSGIQIMPEVAKDAAHTVCFARSKTWISPAPGINEPTENDPEVDDKYNYTPAELKRFIAEPDYLLAHRRALADRRIQNFKRSMAGSKSQIESAAVFTKAMTDRLGETEKGKQIAKCLIPEFPVGCRRLTPGSGFLEALLEDNVDLVWDNLGQVTETGITTKDGSQHFELDAIVCATGFNTDFQPAFPLLGKGGINMRDKWTKDDPEGYFGLAVTDFPNYFTFIGPNSPISNGSLVQAIQMSGIYIYNCITKMQTQGIRSMMVTRAANDEYNEHCQEYLRHTVWVGSCRSWYKRGTIDGKVVALYSGSCYHFIEALRQPRWEDYQFDYVPGKVQNRFCYLGNGFTKREVEGKTVGETQTLNFEEYWGLMNLPAIYE